eukprot:3112851-Rhodomonas_salina.1
MNVSTPLINGSTHAIDGSTGCRNNSFETAYTTAAAAHTAASTHSMNGSAACITQEQRVEKGGRVERVARGRPCSHGHCTVRTRRASPSCCTCPQQQQQLVRHSASIDARLSVCASVCPRVRVSVSHTHSSAKVLSVSLSPSVSTSLFGTDGTPPPSL